MARYYIDEKGVLKNTDDDAEYEVVNGTINKRKKKKKEKQSDIGRTIRNIASYISPAALIVNSIANKVDDWKDNEEDDDIAPISEKRTVFTKGAFEDGYQLFDGLRTISGTTKDIRENLMSGVIGIVEPVIDAGADLVGGIGALFGADDFDQKMQDFKAKEIIDEEKVAKAIIKGTDTVAVLDPSRGYDTDDISVLGEMSDSFTQSIGQQLGVMALQYLGVPWQVTQGITSYGGEVENAAQQGATANQGRISGLISAGATVVTGSLFGGSGLGEKGLINTEVVTKGIKNRVVKAFADYGVDMATEGVEEVVEALISNLGSAIYRDESLEDIMFSEEALDSYVESFVSGGLSAGLFNVGKLRNSVKKGKDYRTGLTADEQQVFDKVYEDAIAKKETGGKKLTSKEKAEIYDRVREDMERGYISAEDIESVLGGEKHTLFTNEAKRYFGSEDFKAYKKAKDAEEAARKEFDPLVKMKQGEMTGEQIYRRDELKKILDESKVKELETKLSPETERIMNLRNLMRSEVFEKVKGTKLEESYRELARKQQKYEVDVEKYKGKAKETVQNIIDSGLGDNSNQFHELVDFLAKISSDKGVTFNFTKTELLKGTKHYKEGYITNGFVDDNGNVVLNKDSNNAIHTIVGHEVTHVLEKTNSYKTLQAAVRDYCIAKEGLKKYNARLKAAEEAYKGKKNTTPEGEVTADIIGEYLFTDSEFVNQLSIDDRSTFQKIYDEIKYLWKVATAGSHEKRELERVKKIFDKAWRENVKGKETKTEATEKSSNTEATIDPENDSDLDYESPEKYSVSVTDPEMIEFLENQEHITTYKAMVLIDGKLYPPMASKVKGEDGKYHLSNGREIGEWMQAEEDTTNIKFNDKGIGYYDLKKDDGGTVRAAYNPYEHSSNLVLNDQFEAAYKRENLVTVECVIPKSEIDSPYTAEYAKDSTGVMDWHSGVVAGKLSDNKRSVYLSRYLKATRILSDAEVAQKYKEIVGDLAVPFNVVSPGLLTELENVGVNIDYDGSPQYQYLQRRAAEREAKKQNKAKVSESVKVLDSGTVTKYSLSTWTPDTQDLVRDNLVKAGFGSDQVDKWIKDTNSVAAVIAADKDRLDFVAADNQTMLKNNQEYVKTLDASTLCAKRLVYQGTFDAIQHRMPNQMLSSDDLIDLLNMMKAHGVQTPCGVCYVESRRRHLPKFAQEWLNSYDGEYKPNLDQVTTSDGLEKLRKSHPQTYQDFVDAMNKKGSSNPKVVQLRTEYRNEIMSLTKAQIRKIEAIGGLRVQSFSDFETPHMLDMMQAVMDMSAKGLSSQAYTKVPNFAWVFGNTGIKINLSLIADGDGFDSNGNLAFSSTEGMDINEAMKLRDSYSQNVGTIIVGANDKHILACMADDRIDFIIPFHRSGWGMKELEMMGMDSYTDYTYGQKEHDLATGKGVENLYPPDYWDYNLSGKENAERYLNLCAKTGREPKFSQFLVNNGDGTYSLQPDGSTDGYWKTLIDFKMYDNEGNGAPQQKVLPNFNMEEAYRVLNEYEGGANKLPVANDVVDEFVAKYDKHIAPQYSFTKDSEGNKLTEAQDEFFRDSVIRDENGSLMPMYHGTKKGGFTVFDGGKDYWYFTKDEKYADTFEGRREDGEYYPIVQEGIDEGYYTPQKYAVYLNVKNPFITDDIDVIEDALYWDKTLSEQLRKQGYDALMLEDMSQVIVLNPNQIKNMDNTNPSEDNDIRYSLTKDSEGKELTTEQAKFFKDSKVTDSEGNLKVVYHGSPADFNTFSLDYLGTNGTAEGYGFYFTDRKNVAEGYANSYEVEGGGAGKLFEVYLNIKKPLSDSKLTITKAQFKKFLTKLNGYVDSNGDRLDVLSNYGDVEWEGLNAVLNTALETEYDYCDSDVDLIQSIINGCRDMKAVFNVLRDTVGYDGIIVNEASWGGDQTIYIAFHPEQIKNTDNAQPTTNPDIRFSLSPEGEEPGYGYVPSRDIGVNDDFAPIREDAENTAEDIAPDVDVAENETATEEPSIAPDVEEPNIKTTKEKLNEKLTNRQKELDNIQRLRAENAQRYDEQIAKAQAELDSKKNKDTKVANRLKMRIERLQRLKADIDARYAKRIRDIQKGIDKTNEELEKDHTEKDRYAKAKARIEKVLELDKATLREEYATKKAEMEAKTADKDAYFSNMAKELYEELRGLRNGVRASTNLGSLLDAGFDWGNLRSALSNVRYNPSSRVNDSSAEESAVRQLINESFENDVYNIDDIDLELAEKISKLEAKAEDDKQSARRATQRIAKSEQYTKLWKDLIGDTSTWKDMALGLQYKTKTLRRILRNVVRGADGKADIQLADDIYDELETKYDHNEALLKQESQKLKQFFADLKLTKYEDTYSQMLGELRHNPETTLTEDVVKEYFNKHKNKINPEKVDKAIEASRKLYDDLIVRVNEVLREQGFKEIPYRQGYFPHFTNPKQTWWMKALNWKPVDNEIPTSIAGLTETFKPQRSWQKFDKHRYSDQTDYSLYKGLDTYIHGALDWIYHIEDLQKRRSLENYLRTIHSDEGIKARIEEIKNSNLDSEEAQKRIDDVLAEAKNPLGGLVRELMNRTNTLANKKAASDRAMEDDLNRKIYSTMTNLNNRVSANMVVGSLSSAMTNFIPIVQSWHEVSPVYSVKGLGDMVRSTIKDDGVVAKSDFLTNRLMNEEALYKTNWDKAADKAAVLMNVFDNITAQTVWRSKYLQNLSEHMSEAEAIKNADQFAKNVIAGRSRGNMPTIFDAKNPVTKLFTAFQLEVANQYGYMFDDVVKDSKNKSRLVKGYATAFVGAYVYNALYSTLVGRDAAFDPIGIIEDLMRGLFDDDEENEDVLLDFGEDILQEVPFVGGLFGGGRVPIQSAIPYSGDSTPFKSMLNDFEEGNTSALAKEFLKPLYYLAMPFGGGQIKKTVEGLGMYLGDHPIDGSYTDSGNLRFPVDDHPLAIAQAALFGQYASKNARDYFDNEWAPLKDKQITEYSDLDMDFKQYHEIREALKDYDTLAEKVEYIDSLDISVKQKNILVNNLTDRETPIDMGTYGEYGDLEEFDFAQKNPGKYAIAKVYGYDQYKAYTNSINDISGEKDSNGKTISGSRKAKVYKYINSLPLSKEEKMLLFKAEYPSDDSYNREILEWLDSMYSLDEIKPLLEELGFQVYDGRVIWD